MAWLNLNDSLNSIKGQITNLATDFLSDGIIQSGSNQNLDENPRVKELEDIIVSQQNEIDKLKSEIEELSKLELSKKDINNVSQNTFSNHHNHHDSNDVWNWTEHNNQAITTSSNNLTTITTQNSQITHNDFHLTKLIDEIIKINRQIKEMNIEMDLNNKEIYKLNQNCHSNTNLNVTDVADTHRCTIDIRNLCVTNKKLLTEQTQLYDNACKNYEKLKILIEHYLTTNNDFESLSEENRRLALENQELLDNLNQLDQDCQQTTEKLVVLRDTLQVDLNKMRAEYEQLNQKNQQLEKCLEQTEKQRQQYEIYYQQHGNDFDEKIKMIQMENDQLRERENHYVTLEKQLNDMTKKYENVVSLSTNYYKEQLTDLFNLLNQQFHTKFTLTDDINYFNTQFAMLKTILDENTSNNNTLWKIDTLEQKLVEVTNEKNAIIQKQEQLLQDYQKSITNLNDQLKNMNSELVFYKDECDELRINNEKLLDDLKMYGHVNLEPISENNEECVVQLEQQLEKANLKINELESKLTIGTPETNIQTIKSSGAHASLLERIKQLECDKSSLKSMMTNLTSECNEWKEKYGIMAQEVDFYNSQIKIFDEKLKNSKMNETSLKLQLDTYKKELEHCFDETNANNQLIKPLELKIEKLEQDVIERNDQLLQNQEIIVNLKQWEKRFVASAYHVLLLQKQRDILQNDIIDKDNYIKELNVEICNIKQNSAQLEENLKIKEKELEILRENYKKLQSNLYDNDSIVEKNKQLEQENMRLMERITEIEMEIDSIKNEQIVQYINKIQQLEHVHEQQTNEINVMKIDMEKLSNDFNELMNVVSIKHTENINYHNEIQRLNTIIVEEKQQYEQQIQQLQTTTTNTQEIRQLQTKIHELNEIVQSKTVEIEQLNDKNNFLTEKCDILTQNLLTEQSKLYELSETHQQCSHAVKELERLRQHLLQLEETHTQEMLMAERKQKELEEKVLEMEQRERDNSTIYTSVSIRANQQVETLQKQIQLANQQRDEYQMKLSEAEDRQMKQMAALTNLQCVLEQFQKDKEKEIEETTQIIYKKLQDEIEKEKQLQHEIELLKSQLNESKQGLKAASRLQEQLEKCRHQICTLKDEVQKSNEQLTAREHQITEMMSQTDGKVDKMLVKNLFIGYLTSYQQNKDIKQILKVIGTVLDFSKEDYEKINHDTISGGSWLKNILRPNTTNDGNASETSLSEAFVRFLENESRPKPELPLLPSISNRRRESVDSDISSSSASQISGTQTTSLLLNQVLLPTFENFSHTRNSSSILKDVLKDNSTK